MSQRPLESPYIAWAKAHHGVRYNLASSGVPPPPLSALQMSADDWALTEDHEDGWMPLRERIADRYGVTAQHVVVAAGASMANHLVCALFLEPGDVALVEHPGYEPLRLLPSYFHADVDSFGRSRDTGYRLDPKRIEDRLTKRTRLVILSNLHNPSGRLAARSTMKAIGRLAEERNFHVLVDEVYLEWLHDKGERTATLLSPRFVTTRSLTKAYGLDAARAGWILADPPIAERLRRLVDLFSVKTAHASERLALKAFEHVAELSSAPTKAVTANLGLVEAFVAEQSELSWTPPDAGTVGFVQLRGVSVDDLVEELKARDTLVAPGRFFGEPDSFRIGFGMNPPVLEEGLARFKEALRAAKAKKA
ncbi:MAG TPA: pyridoxal phosphate-dependent aminotransferase [Vicinamibacteria bacterium]|nr:pyridoxal phosphate-dependent aminotransferase [Vicinamibacteria bacterium]